MSLASQLTRKATRVATQEGASKVAVRTGKEVSAKVVKPVVTTATRDAIVITAKKTENTAFTKAVAGIEARVNAEKALQKAGNPAKLHLQAHNESIFKAQANAKGTVVMYHGFTAGPWQYREMADKFYKEGYNVYVPRLPGHGLMKPNGQITGEGFISAANRAGYDDFIASRYQEAAALGAPVFTVGLSGGANLALRTAEKFPEVKGAFAMAPFLGPDGGGGTLFRVLSVLDKGTFGLLGRILDLIPKGKNGLADAANRMPHTQPSFGAALAMQQVGDNVAKINAPVQIVSTAGDKLSGVSWNKPLFERIGGASENGWYHFSADEKVQHAMLSREQNKVTWSVDKLNEMALEFVAKGKRVMRLPQ